MISLRRIGQAFGRGARSPAKATSGRRAQPNPRTTRIAVDLIPGFGHDRVVIDLSVPLLPRGVPRVQFMEHCLDRSGDARAPTDTVIAAGEGGVVVSHDLGETWTPRLIAGLEDFRVRNVFTTTEGLHILQEDERGGAGDRLRIALCDTDWTLLDLKPLTSAPWHGSRSIDEAAGVIMFAEYPGNYKRGVPNAPDQAIDHDKDSRVFRSRDGGRTWEVAFQVSWRDIRHFHTVMADPHVEGCWWLSSGDHYKDCRVWRSDDDGDTWTDLTHPEPPYPCPEKFKRQRQAAYRYTDAVILPDGLIWGSDDWLGGRSGWDDPSVPVEQRGGSRVFWAPRSEPLMPEMIGYVGCPIRSIVDVGPAWLLLTEAKHPDMIAGAQVCLLSKERPMVLQQIYLAEVLDGRRSGFTHSVASPAARNGRLFTQRSSADVFDGGPRIFQWDIRFE